MPGRDGRVGGEHATLAHATCGFRKTDALAFDQLPRKLEREKRRMAFVEMVYPGIDSQLLQQARPADSQHHLLHQTSFAITAV